MHLPSLRACFSSNDRSLPPGALLMPSKSVTVLLLLLLWWNRKMTYTIDCHSCIREILSIFTVIHNSNYKCNMMGILDVTLICLVHRRMSVLSLPSFITVIILISLADAYKPKILFESSFFTLFSPPERNSMGDIFTCLITVLCATVLVIAREVWFQLFLTLGNSNPLATSSQCTSDPNKSGLPSKKNVNDLLTKKRSLEPP